MLPFLNKMNYLNVQRLGDGIFGNSSIFSPYSEIPASLAAQLLNKALSD